MFLVQRLVPASQHSWANAIRVSWFTSHYISTCSTSFISNRIKVFEHNGIVLRHTSPIFIILPTVGTCWNKSQMTGVKTASPHKKSFVRHLLARRGRDMTCSQMTPVIPMKKAGIEQNCNPYITFRTAAMSSVCKNI